MNLPLSISSTIVLALALGTTVASAAPKIDGTVETFTSGQGTWAGHSFPVGNTYTFLETKLGHAKPSLRQQFLDTLDLGVMFANGSAGFIGDYTTVPSFTVGLDVDTLQLQEAGAATSRDFEVVFIDYKNPPAGFDGVSVSTVIGTLKPGSGWQRLTLAVPDTRATALPDGWSGSGAYDPVTGAPTLPDGRTFASVLRHVDEIQFRTVQQPNPMVRDSYDVAVDNIFVAANCPGSEILVRTTSGDTTLANARSPFKPCH